MTGKRFFLFLIFIGSVLFLSYQIVLAAVDLIYFTAYIIDDAIMVEWETATEIDNAGFYVLRSINSQDNFEDISGFIPAEGSGVIGAFYQHLDENVAIGNTYYYKLEIVDINNNVE